jgi:hypothetical protein
MIGYAGITSLQPTQPARERGWPHRKNGELLVLAQAQFEVLVTSDKSVPSQRRLAPFAIASPSRAPARTSWRICCCLCPRSSRLLQPASPAAPWMRPKREALNVFHHRPRDNHLAAPRTRLPEPRDELAPRDWAKIRRGCVSSTTRERGWVSRNLRDCHAISSGHTSARSWSRTHGNPIPPRSRKQPWPNWRLRSVRF